MVAGDCPTVPMPVLLVDQDLPDLLGDLVALLGLLARGRSEKARGPRSFADLGAFPWEPLEAYQRAIGVPSKASTGSRGSAWRGKR